MAKRTTIETLTEKQIRMLRHEAVEAADYEAMVMCDIALGEADEPDDYMPELATMVRDYDAAYARRAIVGMISAAEAARDDDDSDDDEGAARADYDV